MILNSAARVKIKTLRVKNTTRWIYSMARRSLRVIPVPVLSDNYAYLLCDESSNVAAAVDPAQPEEVLKVAEREGLTITTVLTTHHHNDHAGGNIEMARYVPNITIVGGDDRIPAMNRKVKEGDEIQLGNLSITCRFTPCHTSGHVLYIAKGADQTPSLFCGDTLFIAGCGKFFEGTATQMNYALNTVVAGLPKQTQVWCGHEYTLNNMKFALHVDPENTALKSKFAWALAERGQGKPTVPSTVEEELTYNPFMRVFTEAIKRAVGSVEDTDDETMHKLRIAKNEFK